MNMACLREEKGHKLEKNPRDTSRVSLGHPAGQTGVYQPVSQGFPVSLHKRKLTGDRICRDTGDRPAVPGTPGCSGDFQKLCVIFSCVPCLLPSVAWEKIAFRRGQNIGAHYLVCLWPSRLREM